MPDITANQVIKWLEIYRPRINWNIPTMGMVEIMGMTSDKHYYLFSGHNLKEAVIKAMENIKC